MVQRTGVKLHYQVLDHTDVLFSGQGVRAITLSEREDLAKLETLYSILGAQDDPSTWFQRLAHDYERTHHTAQ